MAITYYCLKTETTWNNSKNNKADAINALTEDSFEGPPNIWTSVGQTSTSDAFRSLSQQHATRRVAAYPATLPH
jgi:hypothetical protein